MAETDSTSSNTQGAHAPILDRDTASAFNAFIGDDASDTMARCERAISDMGYVVSGADEMGINFDKSNLFRIFEVVTSALRYEVKSKKIAKMEGAQS